MSELSVDREAARRYADALFGRAPRGALVEVRFRVPLGMGQRFHSASLLDRLVESIVALSARTDVYVGVLPRRRRGGGRGDVIERAGVVWADCDTGESVGALRAFRPLPAMVVASSEENRHAYWFLTEPVEPRCDRGDEPADCAGARRRRSLQRPGEDPSPCWVCEQKALRARSGAVAPFGAGGTRLAR